MFTQRYSLPGSLIVYLFLFLSLKKDLPSFVQAQLEKTDDNLWFQKSEERWKGVNMKSGSLMLALCHHNVCAWEQSSAVANWILSNFTRGAG